AALAPGAEAAGEGALHAVDTDAREVLRGDVHVAVPVAEQQNWRVLVGHPAAEDGQPTEPDVETAGQMAPGEGLRLTRVVHRLAVAGRREAIDVEQRHRVRRPRRRHAAFQIHPLHVTEVRWPRQALAPLATRKRVAAEREHLVVTLL